MAFVNQTGNVVGWSPGSDEALVINRTGSSVAKGQLLALDIGQTDGDVSDNDVGSENSGLTNVIAPTTAELAHGIFCVALEGADDDKKLKAKFSGIVQALVSGTNAAAVGEPLTAVNAQDELESDTPAAGSKVLGRVLDATAAGTAELTRVLFDGANGLDIG